VIPHDDEVDLALAADENADLTVCLPGYLAELPGQLVGENPVDGDFAAVELLDATNLAGFETGYVAIKSIDALTSSMTRRSVLSILCKRVQGPGKDNVSLSLPESGFPMPEAREAAGLT
jgi:hypothetical protein